MGVCEPTEIIEFENWIKIVQIETKLHEYFYPIRVCTHTFSFVVIILHNREREILHKKANKLREKEKREEMHDEREAAHEVRHAKSRDRS